MDVEAYALVVELLSQAHNYGESISAKLELWVGISSGLIVMAYFAPERLKLGVAGLVIFAYVTFTTFIITNIADDGALSAATIQDARMIVEMHDLKSETLTQRLIDADSGRGSSLAFVIFFLTLFVGTVWYLAHTAWSTFNQNRSKND